MHVDRMHVEARFRTYVKRLFATIPAYVVLPPGHARRYAGIHYHGRNSSTDTLGRFIEANPGDPARHYSAGWLAAQAAFATGRDDAAEELLGRITRRFPYESDPYLLWAELRTYHGDYAGAAARADRARLLAPDTAAAAALAVRLHHLLDGGGSSDEVAASALRCFPTSSKVLWAVSKCCRSSRQFERLADVWREAVSRPDDVRAGIRPLAIAAAHAERLDAAVELYAEGILLELAGSGRGEVRRKSLDGKDPWRAVLDVRDALDAAGIPYFFAAGTALGLVREGRPLGHDADIDVGVFDEDWDPAVLREAFRKHPRFVPAPAHPRSDKVGVKHRDGAPIDVFRFYRENGRLWHDGTFMRWSNSPFEVERHVIRGEAVPLPGDADRYLSENYGDWRMPAAEFDAFTDAPNVSITWPEYFEIYLVRRAHARFTRSEVRAAMRDLRRADAPLRRTPSGRHLLRVLDGGEAVDDDVLTAGASRSGRSRPDRRAG